jgi:Delta7-sterol 5-desaturase
LELASANSYPHVPPFELPLRPVAIVKWFAGSWLPLTEFGVYVLLAIAVWTWVQPPPSDTKTLSMGWVSPIWLRNMVLMVVFATALHLWLYTWRRQGDEYRFMRKAPTAGGKVFLGGNQLRDNVFWTLASGVTIWTVYEAAMWVAYANGVTNAITFASNPVWFVLCFAFIVIWQAFHFYCVHRFLHWKAMYGRLHVLHYRNITIGPWSGFSMHPVEHLLYLSSRSFC